MANMFTQMERDLTGVRHVRGNRPLVMAALTVAFAVALPRPGAVAQSASSSAGSSHGTAGDSADPGDTHGVDQAVEGDHSAGSRDAAGAEEAEDRGNASAPAPAAEDTQIEGGEGGLQEPAQTGKPAQEGRTSSGEPASWIGESAQLHSSGQDQQGTAAGAPAGEATENTETPGGDDVAAQTPAPAATAEQPAWATQPQGTPEKQHKKMEKKEKNGTPLLVASSGLWGVYAFGTLGWMGERADVGVPLGIASGAILGAGGAYLMTLNNQVTMADAGYILGSELWGGAAGWTSAMFYAANTENPDLAQRRVRTALSPLGMGAGLLFGVLSDREDVASLHLAGVAGLLGTTGLNLLWDPSSDSEALGAALTSTGLSLAHLGAGTLLGRNKKLTQNDAYFMLHLTSHAADAGFLIPYYFSPDPSGKQSWGGALTMSSIGLFGSRLLAQRTEFTPRQTTTMSYNGLLGQSLGAGVLMSLGSLNDVEAYPDGIWHTVTGAIAGQSLGLTLGAVMRKRVEEEPATLGYQVVGSLLGLYQAAGIGWSLAYHDTISDNQYIGLILTSVGAGGLAGLGFHSTDKEHDTATPWILATGTAWGAWYGAWTGVMFDASMPDIVLMSTLGSDLGFGAGMLFATPNLDLSPTGIGYTSLCGVAGAALADVVILTMTGDAKTLGAANIAGATAGLIAGALTSKAATKHLSIDLSGRLPKAERLSMSLDAISRWHPILSVAPIAPLAGTPAIAPPAGSNAKTAEAATPAWGLNLSLTQPVKG